jgi:GDP-L-fucose synthase
VTSSDRSRRVLLAGHSGLVGQAVHRALAVAGYADIVLASVDTIDLREQTTVREFLAATRPGAVIVAAARVGGIMANWEQPYEFIADNLAIELNLIDAAYRSGVRDLIFLGSSCIYPRDAPQPLKEDYLLTGPLEETNRAYAVAKIAGIELCRSLNREYGTNYLSLMPTNLYGPGDNFDLHSSHVLPALVRRFHEARLGLPDHDGLPREPHAPVTLWGSGTPRREFLHVDDLARAVLHVLENIPVVDVPDGLLNVGCGVDQTISELAELVQKTVGHRGRIEWDAAKPDGTPRKLLDVSRLLATGWEPAIPLDEGVAASYAWYVEHCTDSKGAFVSRRD